MPRSAFLLVLLVATAALAAPLPGETPIAPPALGAAPGWRTTPAAAVSANRLLSVWIDRRAEATAIFGMLLDRNGAPVLERSFRIGAMDGATTVAAASNGRDFLVAWGRTDGFREYAIRFARVDEQGVVTPLATTLAGRGNLKLVWSGTRYVLLSGTPQPVLAVLTSDGAAERSGMSLTLDPVADAADARIATDGRSGLFLTWVDRRDFRVHGGLVATEQLLDGTFAPFATPASTEQIGVYEHAVAWNGSEYLIAWLEVVIEPPFDRLLRVRRLSRTGEPLSAAQTVYRAPVLSRPHVAWTGANWAIAGIPTQREAIRVSAEGVRIGEPFALSEALNVEPPPVVAADGGAFAVWTEGRENVQTRGDVILPAGTTRHAATQGVLLSRGGARQDSAAVASCGSDFAVAWVETSDRARIRGSISGNTVGMPASDRAQTAPAIGCAGTSALVVWTEPGANLTAELIGSIVTAAGASPAFSLGTTTSDARPAVAWNGSRYLVAWKSAQTQQLILSLLDAAGREVEPPVAAQDLPPQFIYSGDRNAAIAWNGAGYFLAWQHTRVMQPEVTILPPLILYNELRTLRLTAGRTRLGPVRNHVSSEPANPRADAGAPALAASPNGFLLAWPETDWHTAATTLKTLRFDGDGQPLDGPDGIALAPANGGDRVSAAWNGSEYEIAVDRRVFTVFPDGRTTSRTVLADGEAEVLAYAGDRPLLAFTRADPDEGTLRLWGLQRKPRRRPAR